MVITAVSIGALVAWMLREAHLSKRKEERRCTCPRNSDGYGGPCDSYTRRHYRMIHDEVAKSSRFGERFHWYVLDECEDGHVRLIKGGPDVSKFFNSLKIAWRRISDPEQFRSGEELFARAGIIPEAVAPIAERVRRAARDSRNRAGYIKARLDKPPFIEITQTHTQTRGLRIWVVSSPLAQPSHRRFPKN
jgi:hypothetical protein